MRSPSYRFERAGRDWSKQAKTKKAQTPVGPRRATEVEKPDARAFRHRATARNCYARGTSATDRAFANHSWWFPNSERNMPSIVLKLIDAPTETAEGEPDSSSGPLFRGNGDIDYVCGNCGFVIVSGFSANQHVIAATTACPTCGATNEFPPELRA